MKTIFVVSDEFVQKHVGEEYDAIVYVTDCPDTTNINGEAMKMIAEFEKFGKDEEVSVVLDAAPVYYTIIENVIGKCNGDGYKVKASWQR